MRKEMIRQEFAKALPRIQRHAEIVFRSVRCPHRRADCTAEVLAISWKWWLRLRRTGKDPNHFVSAIATFAARAVRSGRRLCGQERANDALSPRAQRLKGFAVCTLPAVGTLSGNPFAEALRDNTHTPVNEQVAFRLDFPAWLATYDRRKRDLIESMARGERTLDLADAFGMSPGRISQLRREFMVGWNAFTDSEDS